MARIGAVMLVRDDGAVLLQHRDDKPNLRAAGEWVPPGGHCDPGESPLDCARREFREETGYECRQLHHYLTLVNVFDPGWPPQQLTIFWARYDGVQSLQCFEGQEVAFVTRKQAEHRKVPGFVLQVWDELLGKLAAPDPFAT